MDSIRPHRRVGSPIAAAASDCHGFVKGISVPEDDNPQPESVDRARRALHLARGIVMAMRRTDQTTAFSEMITAAHVNGVTVVDLAHALIDLVSRKVDAAREGAAHRAAREQWGFELRRLTEGTTGFA